MVNQFLALSLFIVLLCFFIVLNSISTFEIAKARPVLDSLGLAFRTENADPLHGMRESIPLAQNQDTQNAMSKGSTVQRVEGFFSSQIEGVETKQNRLGTELAVRLAFKDFEKEINEELTPGTESKRFLPMLVSLLDTQQMQGVEPYRMDMVLETKEKPYSAEGEKASAALVSIAGRLETAGIPARLMGAGLSAGEAGMLTLYFRRHEPFHPEGMVADTGQKNP
ncbi:MAG: hypothetical protein IT559_06155 [Alphaproteobacteria bacterium]|nr:hypothetical protein [Alphaproteobacteria bacterium]